MLDLTIKPIEIMSKSREPSVRIKRAVKIIVKINIIAEVNIFNHRRVNLVKMIIGLSPKQFEDRDGNIWFAKELSNFEHINPIKF